MRLNICTNHWDSNEGAEGPQTGGLQWIVLHRRAAFLILLDSPAIIEIIMGLFLMFKNTFQSLTVSVRRWG